MQVASVVEKAKQFLFARRYQYRRTFECPPGQAVLADLAAFCRAGESTFHENQFAAARLDGRREVWLRISHHLNLSERQLWDLYDGRTDE